jgi:hypothetical protein
MQIKQAPHRKHDKSAKTYLDYLKASDLSVRAKKFYEKVYKNGGNVKYEFKKIKVKS